MLRHDAVKRFSRAVKDALAVDIDGWGIAGRYEAKKNPRRTHEALIRAAACSAGFQRENSTYSDGGRADGVLSHSRYPDVMLRYEVKSVFLPHYWGAAHPHNQDFERLLRYGHPAGALSDIARLRSSPEPCRVFVLLGIAWTPQEEQSRLRLYERHRDILLETFRELAGIDDATYRTSLRGRSRPWSARLWIWEL